MGLDGSVELVDQTYTLPASSGVRPPGATPAPAAVAAEVSDPASTPRTAEAPAPEDERSPASARTRIGALVAGGIALVAAAVALTVVLMSGTDRTEVVATPVDSETPATTAAPETTIQAPETTTQAPDTTTPAPETTAQAPPTTTPQSDQPEVAAPPVTVTTPPGAAGELRPVGATATAALEPQRLCDGEEATYVPANLVDGDLDTGWAVSGDGSGQSVTVDFGHSVRLTSVGMTPGYTKLGPRGDPCRLVSSFEVNRIVSQVRYEFDDGSTMEQQLAPVAQIQHQPVDVTTRRVTIHILATDLPPGADDDTVISEARFEGVAA
jgi:hypothetical protein